MRFLVLYMALVAAWLGAAGAPARVEAHFGGGAFIIVPADHVNPGESFEVIAADMGPNATVTFRVEHDEVVAPLSPATAGPDGHFTTNLTLPANYPTGYALLVASSNDGSQTSTWVLVGARDGATPPRPDQLAWWADPSVIVLGIAVLGGAGVLGYTLLRRRQPKPVAVGAGQRRRSSGKATRRATRRGQV
jgi:hypothetical protein